MNHEELQARRAAIQVGDIVYSPAYGYNHSVLDKLVVTKVTPKQIVCGKTRFWKMTGDRVGRSMTTYYTDRGGNYYLPDELWLGDKGVTYAERYEQLRAEQAERETRHALYLRITRFSYHGVPIEIMQQMADLIQPYEEAEADRLERLRS